MVGKEEVICIDPSGGGPSSSEDGIGDDPAPAERPLAAGEALQGIRHLHQQVMRIGAGSAALQQVPPDLLSSLLRAVQPVVEAGGGKLLQEGDSETDEHVQAAFAALEAATVAVRLMTMPGLPQQGEAP